MTNPTLASTDDLNAFLQRTVPPTQAALVLAMATAAIQSEVSQQLFYTADDTVRLVVVENAIILPQRPVVDVTAVESLTSGEWVLVQDRITPAYLLDGGINSAWWTDGDYTDAPWWSYVAQLPWQLATVTYSHGFQEIPDDLRGVCLTVAARLVGNPEGLQQEQVANVMVRYDRAGGAGLTDFEKAVIDRYKRTGSTVRLLPRPMHTDRF